jgi:hypothetical protein
MKYTIQKRLIEEYEVEADSKEEVMSLLYGSLETNPKLKIISREDSLKILEKLVNKDGLYSIPDGNDYNYTGYRPFSNKDGSKLEEYRFTDRTSTGRNPY